MLEPPEPFVGTVEDREGRPVAGAIVRLEIMRRLLPDGTVTDTLGGAWSLVQTTPMERLFRVVSDEKGAFRFPALPKGARAGLLVTARGMADLRTRDINDPRPILFKGMSKPLGDTREYREPPLLEGYLSGTPDAPAWITMTPGSRVQGRVTTKLRGVTCRG
ncbi:MAG: carboxypeptidase-like regulatory domain-containing protein [Singulisphaera sp.]